MSYLVLARKWRPQSFTDMVGQQHIARVLTNAIQSGRIAHCYLFTGVRGVGKTSAARILAKGLNCVDGPTPAPCNECPRCQEINDARSIDVYEIDGASNRGIDEVRQIIENVRYQPAAAPSRRLSGPPDSTPEPGKILIAFSIPIRLGGWRRRCPFAFSASRTSSEKSFSSTRSVPSM